MTRQLALTRRGVCLDCGKKKGYNYSLRCRSCAMKIGGLTHAFTERNEEIVNHWLHDTPKPTHTELAAQYQLSPARISQILRRAIPGNLRLARREINRAEFLPVYDAQPTVEDIAETADISNYAVRDRIKRWGLAPKPSRRAYRSQLTKETIVAMYQGGVGTIEITRRLGLSGNNAVYMALKDAGITERQHPLMAANHWKRSHPRQ